MQNNKKKITPELILTIAIAILTVIFITLIILIFIRNNTQPTNTQPENTNTAEDVSREEEIDYTVEDDAEADDSVTTRQFNTALKSDMSTYINSIVNYQANNRGAIPLTDDNWNHFDRNYLETDFTSKYSFVHCDHEQGNCTLPTALTWTNNANIIYTAVHAICSNGTIEYTTGKRKIAAYTHLKGETNGIFCINN